jgi:hypothetical protein
LKRAKVEATIYSRGDGQIDPKKKWWNAQAVIRGLQNIDESDLSDEEDAVGESEGSDEDEQPQRRRTLSRATQGKMDAKTMESPVSGALYNSNFSISLR